jgi:ATP-dependent helicase/nuclease subunit A
MIEFTTAQKNAIGLEALDTDTCVVAGPGSGKTTVLIERFRGLVESGVSPLRILAITFTEKATNQMRERLARAFADQPEVGAQIQRAYVSTVHGFCTRLLRENAILAGVDPRFRVLDEQETFALERKSAIDSLDLFLIEDPGPVRDLLQSLYSPDLADSILEVYETMRAAGMSFNQLTSAPIAGARAAIDNLAAHCAQIASGTLHDWSPSQKEQLPPVAEWAARIRRRAGQPVDVEDFEILAGFNCNLNKLRRNNKIYDLIRQLKNDLMPAAESLLVSEFYATRRATLIEAIGRFDALYRSRKDAQSALDFSDLEEFTVRLLEENEEARQRIRRQFDHVLMDEFQDTNGLQSKLLDLLRSPDRFYAVGDINQSIYGFRHADPEVFRAYRGRVESNGQRLAELRENWRSRANILHAVESLIGASDGIERHNFQPVRKFRRKSAPCVEVIRCLADEMAEAKWVASRIAELHGTLPLESGPARFGDMAVLVRKADNIQPLAKAFDEARIPYVVTAGKGFFESREVSDLTHLLRAVANPLDEISLAAVLRSPLVGASDATLWRLKQAGALTQAMATSDAEAVRDFHRELTAWREARHHVSADRLAVRAMDRAGYELGLRPRQQANVEKFLNLVRDAGSRQSLDELVDELQRLRESDPRAQDSQAEDIGDAVRVLTVHSAKGLEFPVVFLPALQTGVNTRPAPVLLSPRLGLGVRWRNPVTGRSAKDSLYEDIAQDLRRRESEESNRLLYVAMTRAEEHLVLSCSGPGKLTNWAAYLESNWNLNLTTPWDTAKEISISAHQFLARVVCSDRPPAPAAQLALALEPESPQQFSLPTVSGQHDSTASVTSVAMFADCPRRYYLARYLGWDGDRPPIPAAEDVEPERDDLDATEFGRQVHALLAGAPRNGSLPAAVELADRFTSSDLGRQAAQSSRVEREFDFLLALEDVVLRGQIDLWFDSCIVDYKTDDLTPEEVPARAQAYALQLQLYAIAIERLIGKAPDAAILYFLRPNLAIPVDVTPSALAKAVAITREFQQAQDRIEFPLREGEHCQRCPYFRGMCPAPSTLQLVPDPTPL